MSIQCTCGKVDCELYGVCHCGCGNQTRISPWSNKASGYVKGKPRMFIRFHNRPWTVNIKSRNEPRFETVDGVQCVWIPMADGRWALTETVNYTDEVRKRMWRCTVHGYAICTENDNHVFLHKLIFGAPKGVEVDHENGIPLDCRLANLRPATRQEQCWNSGISKNNTSGCRGVSETPAGKWRARMYLNGVDMLLGTFWDKDTAIAVRKEAERKHYGKFQRKG